MKAKRCTAKNRLCMETVVQRRVFTWCANDIIQFIKLRRPPELEQSHRRRQRSYGTAAARPLPNVMMAAGSFNRIAAIFRQPLFPQTLSQHRMNLYLNQTRACTRKMFMVDNVNGCLGNATDCRSMKPSSKNAHLCYVYSFTVQQWHIAGFRHSSLNSSSPSPSNAERRRFHAHF